MVQISQRSQAEDDYGKGRRRMPPKFNEMSPTSQHVVATGFGETMSNIHTREANMAATGAKGALEPGQISRLTDTEGSISTAAGHLAGAWDRMMASPNRPQPA